jgi:hypothetical protein
MFLFLDDIRTVPVNHLGVPRGNWVVARSYLEFCDMIIKYWADYSELPQKISFDFDLANEHYCGDYSKIESGLDCAQFLVDFCSSKGLPLPTWHCHSLSQRKGELIELLVNAGKSL